MALYDEYGTPVKVSHGKDSLEVTAFYFYKGAIGESGLTVLLKPYDGNEFSEEYLASSAQCQWGIKVNPCKNPVVPWNDERCYKHNCFVFGCDTNNVWSDAKGYPICISHEDCNKVVKLTLLHLYRTILGLKRG